jgi:hypothetical protein
MTARSSIQRRVFEARQLNALSLSQAAAKPGISTETLASVSAPVISHCEWAGFACGLGEAFHTFDSETPSKRHHTGFRLRRCA